MIEEEEYIEEEMYGIWKESFYDLKDKVEIYLKKAIEKKIGKDVEIQSGDVYFEEIETAIETIMTDFAQLLNDNLEELEIALTDLMDSFEDTYDTYEEEEEQWGEQETDTSSSYELDDI